MIIGLTDFVTIIHTRSWLRNRWLCTMSHINHFLKMLFRGESISTAPVIGHCLWFNPITRPGLLRYLVIRKHAPKRVSSERRTPSKWNGENHEDGLHYELEYPNDEYRSLLLQNMQMENDIRDSNSSNVDYTTELWLDNIVELNELDTQLYNFANILIGVDCVFIGIVNARDESTSIKFDTRWQESFVFHSISCYKGNVFLHNIYLNLTTVCT